MKCLLVIVKANDPLELPLEVCKSMQECADWLHCSVKTLYRYKRYADYKIIITEDKEDTEL